MIEMNWNKTLKAKTNKSTQDNIFEILLRKKANINIFFIYDAYKLYFCLQFVRIARSHTHIYSCLLKF